MYTRQALAGVDAVHHLAQAGALFIAVHLAGNADLFLTGLKPEVLLFYLSIFLRYIPVYDFLQAATFSGVPAPCR